MREARGGARFHRGVVVLRLMAAARSRWRALGKMLNPSANHLNANRPRASMNISSRTAIPKLANRGQSDYSFVMVIGSIREFNRAVPFVPYEIRMVGGERYTVPHPDFISISPKGTFVVIIDAKDRPHHLSALLIERASPLNGHRRKAGKRSSR
jgi:hypothetical protein